MFTLHIPWSSSNTSMKRTILSFSCIGELTLFFLNLEWNCTFVHCPEMILLHLIGWVACLEQVYVLHTSPTHIKFLYSEWGTDLGVKSSEKPLPSDIQWTNGHLKHCLFLGSFCPQVLVILLPAQSHCCGLLLLWDVIANVLVWCLAYWSSCCPAFLAKWCRVSWRGKTSSGNLILER